MTMRLLFSPLFFILGGIYGAVVEIRNFLYDRGWLSTTVIKGVRVVSVGNLSSGGTGKTPVVALLGGLLQKKTPPFGIVSRGYGRRTKGVYEVHVDSSPRDVGDEPLLLKKTIPQAAVFVGERRVDAVRALLKAHPVPLILADDAFQHRKLHRDLDLVLIDAEAPSSDSWLLPLGKARESMRSLARADGVLLTKTNLARDGRLAEIREKLRRCGVRQVFEIRYELKGLRSLRRGEPRGSVSQVFLMSAIARPGAFRKLIEQSGTRVVGELHFGDHHFFSPVDLEEAMRRAGSLGADCIVVTEKDAVKINPGSGFFAVAELALDCPDLEKLYDLVVGKVH